MEAIGSKSSGSLNIAVNARMLDTSLVDTTSSYIKNEIQDIEITSWVVYEAIVSNFKLNKAHFINWFSKITKLIGNTVKCNWLF